MAQHEQMAAMKAQLEQLKKGGHSGGGKRRDFLVRVDTSEPVPNVRGLHKVSGWRINAAGQSEGEYCVVTVKPYNRQPVPQPGETFEVQSHTMDGTVTATNGQPVSLYTAAYYKAFSRQENHFAMAAEFIPYRPSVKGGRDVATANIIGVDTSKAIAVSWNDFASGKADKMMAQLLQPWTWPESRRTSVTHDINGKSIYERPVSGISPALLIRLMGEDLFVFGRTVPPRNGQGQERNDQPLCFVSPDFVSNEVASNKLINGAKNIIKSSGMAGSDQYVQVCVCFSAQVGYASIGVPNHEGTGFTEPYLPDAFKPDFEVEVTGDDGGTFKARGYNHGLAKIQVSPNGRAAYATGLKSIPAPGSNHVAPATRRPSLTPHELAASQAVTQQTQNYAAPAGTGAAAQSIHVPPAPPAAPAAQPEPVHVPAAMQGQSVPAVHPSSTAPQYMVEPPPFSAAELDALAGFQSALEENFTPQVVPMDHLEAAAQHAAKMRAFGPKM